MLVVLEWNVESSRKLEQAVDGEIKGDDVSLQQFA